MAPGIKILIGAALFLLIGYGGIHGGLVPGVGAASVEARLKQAALASLEDAGLDWAGITMNGQQAILQGTAPDRDSAAAAARTVSRAVFAGGLVAGGITSVDTSRLRFETMRDADKPIASPFTWSAILPDTGPLRLVGFVPDDRVRMALVAEAEALFDRPVADEMQAARGAPDGDWNRAASLGLAALSRLEEGRLTASDGVFRLGGTARTDAAAETARHSLAAFPPGLTARDAIGLAEQDTPEDVETDPEAGAE